MEKVVRWHIPCAIPLQLPSQRPEPKHSKIHVATQEFRSQSSGSTRMSCPPSALQRTFTPLPPSPSLTRPRNSPFLPPTPFALSCHPPSQPKLCVPTTAASGPNSYTKNCAQMVYLKKKRTVTSALLMVLCRMNFRAQKNQLYIYSPPTAFTLAACWGSAE